MTSVFRVYKQVWPEEGNSRPYRIFEMFDTVDGTRSRICDGNWRSLEEAQAVQLEYEIASDRKS